MADYVSIRNLILETWKKNHGRQEIHRFYGLVYLIEQSTEGRALFPEIERQPTFGGPQIPVKYVDLIRQALWDLIFERVFTPTAEITGNDGPQVKLTEFGREVINQSHPLYYDPTQYLDIVRKLIEPTPLDSGIEQYLGEGLRAYYRGLYFASTVMFGAAAEKFTLLLLTAIRDATQDQTRKDHLTKLLEGPLKLPTVFKEINDTIAPLTGKSGLMPYAVHQGRVQHLLSWQEMIRVYRNEAVHPATGTVERRTIFLALQGFPAALETVYKLINWFKSNQI